MAKYAKKVNLNAEQDKKKREIDVKKVKKKQKKCEINKEVKVKRKNIHKNAHWLLFDKSLCCCELQIKQICVHHIGIQNRRKRRSKKPHGITTLHTFSFTLSEYLPSPFENIDFNERRK